MIEKEVNHIRSVIKHPPKLKIYRFLRAVLLWFIFVSLANFCYSYFFDTPKTFALNKRNNELLMQYRNLQDSIRLLEASIREVKRRDSSIYRAIYGIEQHDGFDEPTEYPEDWFSSIQTDRFSEVIIETRKMTDMLGVRTANLSVSLDAVDEMTKNVADRLEYIPAIWPLDIKKTRSIGKFGYRIHPVLRRQVFHSGIDLACDRGTPVYATGNGKVVKTEYGWSGGYGNNVLVDHGYGYMTRYAHLGSIIVRPGQEVKRGEQLAYSGNSGRSTGPHLHYEVIYAKNPVNPMNYFRRDMDEADFQKILDRAKDTTYEF